MGDRSIFFCQWVMMDAAGLVPCVGDGGGWYSLRVMGLLSCWCRVPSPASAHKAAAAPQGKSVAPPARNREDQTLLEKNKLILSTVKKSDQEQNKE